jgi:hypothetical protein
MALPARHQRCLFNDAAKTCRKLARELLTSRWRSDMPASGQVATLQSVVPRAPMFGSNNNPTSRRLFECAIVGQNHQLDLPCLPPGATSEKILCLFSA